MARYITTTLPYVNASPHVGFATEILQADVLARAWRAQGEEVFFSTGTDEHGQKIWQKAQEEGKETQEYVDQNVEQFDALQKALDLSNNAFIRTSDPAHVRAAQELWRRCDAAGDIEKRAYKGLYCVGDEAFVKESDLVAGKCPNHPSLDLIEIEEENYFFRFSKYQDALLAYLSREDCIVPAWRRLEAKAFVEKGLEDFSISREVARMSWGIPVPGDDSQVMYVWFDALTNYISTLGWPEDSEGLFEKYWQQGTTLQMAGKDQVRFQSLMWQAMLMSAGVKPTDQVFYHGFITSGGHKMSKSVGNVISPIELVEKYGTDATRYLLLRHVHPTEDTDITWERLDEWYTANLVNGLGNLVARVMKLSQDNLTAGIDVPVLIPATDTGTKKLQEFAFDEALSHIFSMIGAADLYMTEQEPFKKVKSDDVHVREEGKDALRVLLGQLTRIAQELSPWMPSTSETILAAIASNTKPENLFPRLP